MSRTFRSRPPIHVYNLLNAEEKYILGAFAKRLKFQAPRLFTEAANRKAEVGEDDRRQDSKAREGGRYVSRKKAKAVRNAALDRTTKAELKEARESTLDAILSSIPKPDILKKDNEDEDGLADRLAEARRALWYSDTHEDSVMIKAYEAILTEVKDYLTKSRSHFEEADMAQACGGKTAFLHKVVNKRASVYRLCPDRNGYTFVLVSKAIQNLWSNPREVLVFPCLPGGRVIDWCEIGGSYDEPDGHMSALNRMGYTIKL